MRETDINIYDRIIKASNREYNIGLEKARVRDLSGAIVYLKRALRLNKKNTDARNLLGLVYYEMGDMVEALSQWVISKNLSPKNNQADEYLDDIQSNSGRLEAVNQNIKKFNQALAYAEKGSSDLAVMQLKKVLSNNPKFVKGYLLLGLLYIEKHEYEKAKKALYQVIKIDKNNVMALKYMGEVRASMKRGRRKPKEESFTETYVPPSEDVIIPPSYKENTGWQSVLQILFGLVLGAAVVFFLIMPAKSKSLNNENRKTILSYNDKMTVKDNEIATLEKQIAELEAAKSDVEEDLTSFTDANTQRLAEYNELLMAMYLYMMDDKIAAVERFTNIEGARVTDEAFVTVYSALRKIMEDEGWQIMYGEATRYFGRGDYETAIHYYLKCLELNPEYYDAIYWLGITYETIGEKETANGYYTQVIEARPNSQIGRDARARRGY